MRDVAVVHPGVQHSADLAASLDHSQRLAYLATRLQVGSGAAFPWSSSLGQKLLDRRTSRSLSDSRILRLGVLSELFLRSAGPRLPRSLVDRVDRRSIERFNDRVMGRLDEQISAVIATDTAALPLFRRLAVERPGVARVLDVSHPLDVVVQRLMRDDANAHSLALEDYDDFHDGPPADQMAELEAAHGVIVASAFSASTLQSAGFPAQRVWVVPYGVGEVDPQPRRTWDGTLRLLSLGAMSERKGMTVLLRQMARLEELGAPVHLDLAGRTAGRYRLPTDLPSNCTYRGSPSAADVKALYRRADVLVLPSMCEGFGRTLLEALAHGCSVITTERSGGPDIVSRFGAAPVSIVPVDERDRLADLIVAHCDRPGEYLRADDARQAARAFSEQRYRSELVRVLDEVKATA